MINKNKVCKLTFITTQQDYWGGSELLWVRMVYKALERNYDIQVVVFSQKNGLHPELIKLKGLVRSFIELPNFTKGNSLPEKVFNLCKNKLFPTTLNGINKFNPDVLLISQANTYAAAFNTLFYNFLSDFKKDYFLISQFNQEHESLDYNDIIKARFIFSKAKKIFFVSRRNKEVVERQIACAVDNAVFIDNPVNISKIDYIPFPQIDDTIQIASVARLEIQYKGQDVLFQILGKTQWEDRNWHLNLYGSGPDEKYLKELAHYYKIENKITFHGHVNNIRDVWKKNHILIMPSLAEGKPLAMEEAMICGRACIMSDVAGNSEFIEHGKSGYIATSFLPNEFSSVMEFAWEDKLNWEQIGKEARKSILMKIDLDVGNTILNYIQSV